MKRFQTALVAAMLCIGCLQPFAAQAANYPYSLSVTPFAGGYIFEGNQRLHSTPVYGLALGYNLSEHWALEGVGSFSTNVTSDKSNNEDSRVFGVRGDVLYHFLPEGRLVPYLAIGGGYLAIEPDKGETDDDLMVNYGAGVKFFLTDRVALRADVRHILDINANDIGSHPTCYNNLSYTAGVTFQLGGAPPAVRPAAKAEPAPAVTTVPPASVPPAKIAEKKMEQAPAVPKPAMVQPAPVKPVMVPPAPTPVEAPVEPVIVAPAPIPVKKAPAPVPVEEEPFSLQAERPRKAPAGKIILNGITIDKNGFDMTTRGAVKKFNIFTLTQPSRLVIDVYGAVNGLDVSRAMVNRFGLQAVRFGHHADYLRIVLDAAREELLPYRANITKTGLKINLNPSHLIGP